MKLLLISYYGPPLSSITTLRSSTLASQLAKEHEVHLITRSWEGNETQWEELCSTTNAQSKKKEGNLHTHQLAFEATNFPRKGVRRSLWIIWSWLRGKFSPVIDCTQFESYCQKLLSAEKFDLIYVTSPPLTTLELGHRLAMTHNLPLHVDFRDLKNALTMRIEAKHKLIEKTELALLKRYLRRRLNQPMRTVSVASEGIGEYLSRCGIAGSVVVLNGYEAAFEKIQAKPNNDTFTLSLIGTVYYHQNKEPMTQGIRSFLEAHVDEEILVNFIGVQSIPLSFEYFKKELPDSRVRITGKLPRKEALQIGKDSHVLFYMGWPGFRGIYSGKIFEYLGLKRRILIAPKDNDVIDALLEKTNAGLSLNSAQEVLDTLESWYDEWKKNDTLTYNGSGIEEFTREHQNSKVQAIIENSVEG